MSLSPDDADSASPTVAASARISFIFLSPAVMIRRWTLATSSSSLELCTTRCRLYSVVPTRDLHYAVKRVVQAHQHASHFLARIILPSILLWLRGGPCDSPWRQRRRLTGDRRRKPGHRHSDPESALVARRLKCFILLWERNKSFYILTLRRSMGLRTACTSLASFRAVSAA